MFIYTGIIINMLHVRQRRAITTIKYRLVVQNIFKYTSETYPSLCLKCLKAKFRTSCTKGSGTGWTGIWNAHIVYMYVAPIQTWMHEANKQYCEMPCRNLSHQCARTHPLLAYIKLILQYMYSYTIFIGILSQIRIILRKVTYLL